MNSDVTQKPYYCYFWSSFQSEEATDIGVAANTDIAVLC